MTDVQRALFWPLVAFDLTVAGRSTYTVGADTVEEPAKLRLYNELQHQILPKIISHHNLAKWTVNDSDLLEVIREKAEAGEIIGSVRWALVDAEQKSLNTELGDVVAKPKTVSVGSLQDYEKTLKSLKPDRPLDHPA